MASFWISLAMCKSCELQRDFPNLLEKKSLLILNEGRVSLSICIQIVDKIYYVLSSGPETQLRERFDQF